MQRIVGERHTRFVLRTGDRAIDAIAFNQEPLDGVVRVRAVYQLMTNDYRDVQTLQLLLAPGSRYSQFRRDSSGSRSVSRAQ